MGKLALKSLLEECNLARECETGIEIWQQDMWLGVTQKEKVMIILFSLF